MDKNTIVGFILIAAVLIGFSILNKPSDEELKKQNERQMRDSVEQSNTQAQANQGNQVAGDQDKIANFFDVKQEEDSLSQQVEKQTNQEAIKYTLENNRVKLEVSNKGAYIASAQVKEHTMYDGDSLYLFNNNESALDLFITNKAGHTLKTSDLYFEQVKTSSPESLILRYAFNEKQYVDFIYSLHEDDYMVKFDVNMVGLQDFINRETVDRFEFLLTQKMRRLEKNKKDEQRYSNLYYKYVGDDVKELDATKGGSEEVREPAKWIAFKNKYFASILIADDKIGLALVDSKIVESEEYIKDCQAKIYVPADANQVNTLHVGFRYYFGPMTYQILKQYDDNVKETVNELDLDKLVPLGWWLFRIVNQYFVIPLFNILKSTGLSIGIVILLLTIIVKLLISPLTYKSFMSSAKMRVLRPQVEELNAKYPKQEQAAEKQQAVMALYSRAGANPMSGCVPILLQMPLLIALFQFFPNAIDLRHQSFLWADDLSTYDAIWSFPEGIPLIGGLHLSLFCILMTVTNIIYTKFNMEATNTGQQQMPGMKWMMYLMPLIFFFVLNDYPAGLTYYYFLSLLITILLTLTFRFVIDEEKVLAKLEANKAKPKKKSGFMARLEEAQRMQQQQQKGNAPKGKKKR